MIDLIVDFLLIPHLKRLDEEEITEGKERFIDKLGLLHRVDKQKIGILYKPSDRRDVKNSLYAFGSVG